MKKACYGIFVLFLLCVFTPSAGSAQACGTKGGCGGMWPGGEAWGHHVTQGPIGPTRPLHGECMICVDEDDQEVDWTLCHEECGGAHDEPELSINIKSAVYRLAVAAAMNGRADVLMEFAKLLPESIAVNERRGVVQLFSCGSQLIASLNVRRPVAAISDDS